MKGKYSALTVAKWFLWYNDKILEEEDADLISNLKLQKLLYYAQGCYLALKNEPLFNEQIVNCLLYTSYCRIRIPNEEVKKEFKNITDYYLSLGDGQLNRLMRYFRYEQADKFIKEYKDILYDTKLS